MSEVSLTERQGVAGALEARRRLGLGEPFRPATSAEWHEHIDTILPRHAAAREMDMDALQAPKVLP